MDQVNKADNSNFSMEETRKYSYPQIGAGISLFLLVLWYLYSEDP